jgi:hypothetical protein
VAEGADPPQAAEGSPQEAVLFLTPRFARCRGKHRLRRHLPPQGSRMPVARRGDDQGGCPAPSPLELEAGTVGGRGSATSPGERGSSFAEVPAAWAERNRVDPKAHAMNLPTKAEAVMGLTSLPVHARRLAVAHVDSGSSEAKLHAPAGG